MQMMRRAPSGRFSVLAMLLVAALVSACSGPGSVSTPGHATTGTNGAASGARQATSIRVKIPAGTKPTSSARGRTPLYVSPATLSGGFLVYPVGSTPSSGIIGYADLSATSPLCTVNADGSRICSFSINAPVGNDTFVMTLFDQPLAGGVVPSGAAPLSTNTVNYVVVADSDNPLTFNLDGIPASVVLNPSAYGATPGTASSFVLNVIARDADNYIIAGSDPFTTPITLTVTGDTNSAVSFSSSSYVASTTVSNPSASPVTVYYNGAAFTGQITITAVAGTATGVPLAITSGSGSGTVGVTVPPFPTSAIVASTTNAISSFAANVSGNPPFGYNLTSSPSTGTHNFASLAIDKFGNLFTIDTTSNVVSVFSAPTAGPSIPAAPDTTISVSSGTAGSVAVDSYDNVYVGDAVNHAVYVYAAGSSGSAAPVRVLTSNLPDFTPRALALDSANDLFVADSKSSPSPTYRVEEFAPAASATDAPIAKIQGSNTNLAAPNSVAVDPAGKVFVANSGFTVTVYATGATGNVAPVRSFSMAGCIFGTMTSAAIAVDTYDNVYTSGAGQVCIFPPGTAPSQLPQISGPNTGLGSAGSGTFGSGVVVAPSGALH